MTRQTKPAALPPVADAPAAHGVGHNGAPAPIEYVRPWLYAKQQNAIFDCPDMNGNPSRWGFCEASTKAGKTVGSMAWFFEQALMGGQPGRNYWWIAPVYGQAKIAFGRMKRGIPTDLRKINDGDLTIALPNGATMWFKSGEKPDNLYGEDVWAAVIDEASRVREESYNAIRSTLTATRGPLRCIGNVKGRSNWFYRMCRKAEAGERGMSYAKLTAYDAVAAGVLAAEEIEDAKAHLPENVFRELYLAEPSDDEGNPFGYRHIQSCLADYSELAPDVAGVDLAKSIDWTVVLALDKFGVCCGLERWQSDWEATEARILDLVGRTHTLVDSTGVGDPVFERLQKKRSSTFHGFKFSASSKQQLMEGLVVAIQQGLVKFPDGPLRAELENFEYVYTRTGVRYSAPVGYHDDQVVALALAVEMRRRRRPGGLANIKPSGTTRAISPWLGGMTAQR